MDDKNNPLGNLGFQSGNYSGNTVSTPSVFNSGVTGTDDFFTKSGLMDINQFDFMKNMGGGGAGGGGIMDFLTGGEGGFMGLAGNAMDMFGAISQYGMMKDQLGMQEDQLDFSKNAFNKNSANQAQLVNNRLADQTASRMAYGNNASDATMLGGQTKEDYLASRAVDGSPIK